MDADRLKELEAKFKAKLNEPSPPALERLREFFWAHVHDGDSELLKLEAEKRPASIIDGVEAIEAVLAEPPPPGQLAELVAYEGNRALGDRADATAAAWLQKLASDLRRWLGANAPPLREH